MTRGPVLRGGRSDQGRGDGGGDGERSILRNFVDFLRSGIDRFGDHAVDVRVDGGGAFETGRDLPVVGIECDHGSERVFLRTAGLQAAALRQRPEAATGRAVEAEGAGADGAGADGVGEDGAGLVLRDLLNQLSTAVAQGPDYVLALCDGEAAKPKAEPGTARRGGRRLELSVEGLQVKSRPGQRLAFVVRVAEGE